MRYLQLNDIAAYKIALTLSNDVWHSVVEWDYFSKSTVGKQFVEAVDSISANIAEGFGRRFKRDKIKFYYYAYGSVKESLDWNEKAHARGLIDEKKYHYILGQLQLLSKEINSLVRFTSERMSA